MIDDTVGLPLLEALASCLCQELMTAELPEPCFCGVLPGQLVAIEHCGPGVCGEGDEELCTGGQAWVRLTSVFPFTQFPVQEDLQATCSSELAVQIEIGVARCAPTVADDSELTGEPPTLAQWYDATRLQLADMAAMRRAVHCCLGAAPRDYLLGSYTPFGPDGGCVGGTWTVTVAQGAVTPPS